MSEGFVLRQATDGDAVGIQRVARAAWHAAYDDVLGSDRVDGTVDDWYDLDRLRVDDLRPDDRPFVVAVRDGVVGFGEAVHDGDAWQLYRLYVAPGHWREGVGAALSDRLERTVRDRGADRVELSVLAANERAVAFYEARGFERSGTHHDETLDAAVHEYAKRL